MPLTDDQLWSEVREAGAELGWHDRGAVLQRSHLRLLRKHEWPAGNHGLMKRLEGLWTERVGIMGPV